MAIAGDSLYLYTSQVMNLYRNTITNIYNKYISLWASGLISILPTFLEHPLESTSPCLSVKNILKNSEIQRIPITVYFNSLPLNHDNILLFPTSCWNLPLSNLLLELASLYQPLLTIYSSNDGGILYLQGFWKCLA